MVPLVSPMQMSGRSDFFLIFRRLRMSFVLVVNIRIKPENVAAFMSEITTNALAARSEPGCRQFEVLVDPQDKTRLMLFEVYDSEAAFQEHQARPAFKYYLEKAVPLLASRERQFWRQAL